METNEPRTAVEADLGLSRRPGANTLTTRQNAARSDLGRISNDLQRRTGELMTQSAPETFGQKIVDALIPSPIRAAKRRGEVAMVEAHVDAEVELFKVVRGAQVHQVEALAEAYAATAELQTTEDIAMKGIETANNIDHEIDRSGAEFDRDLDAAVKTASALESESARFAAANRIERRIALRAAVEEAAMHGVRDAVRGVRKRP